MGAYLVVVTHNRALEFRGVDPGHKVLHVPVIQKRQEQFSMRLSQEMVNPNKPCYKECGIRNSVRANTHMALLNELDGRRQCLRHT